MTRTGQPERVVFRKWRSNGDVLALFPDVQADRFGHVNSYEHVGQHGAAEYANCVRLTTPAKPREYAALKAELEGIGYKLRVAKRR